MIKTIGFIAAHRGRSRCSAPARMTDTRRRGIGRGGYVGPVALGDCGGFYDDFYGPLDDGCWGDDGGYWYRAHGERRWRRDGGTHFSHNQVASMHEFHPTGPGAGFHFQRRRHGGGCTAGAHGTAVTRRHPRRTGESVAPA